jgi:AcrR family transcriptional regulator
MKAAFSEHTDLGARERILQESTRLFAQHGFEGTSLRMIAEAVQMQKGSLVYHFESKERIRDAVLDQLMDRWKDVLPQIILTATTGENRFERTITECIGFFQADTNRARFLLREMLDNPEGLKHRVAAQIAPWMAMLAERIEEGKAEGIIYEEVEPLMYVWGVVMMTLATMAASNIADSVIGHKVTSQRIEKEIIRTARAGLFKPQKPSGKR